MNGNGRSQTGSGDDQTDVQPVASEAIGTAAGGKRGHGRCNGGVGAGESRNTSAAGGRGRGYGRGQCGRRAGESRYTIPVAHSKWGYGRHNGFGGSDKPGTARDVRHVDAEVNRVGRRHDVYDKL